jgi:CDP-diacylglycerol--glycerol-3-phosphate 3-phosphatidyltransferase
VASPWNIANALTAARLALVPAFAFALAVSARGDADSEARWRLIAAGLFAVAIATDYLDGALARGRGIETPLGAFLDPLADKALTGVAFVGLALTGLAPWWGVLLILARELGVTLWRFAVARRGGVEAVAPAHWSGKAKTGLQALAVVALLVPWRHLELGWVTPLGPCLFYAALIVTLVSGVVYLRSAFAVATVGAGRHL